MAAGLSPAEKIPPDHPSRLGLWLLSAALGGSYLILQLVVVVPVMAWMLATHQLARRQDALDSPTLILTALVGVAFAASITIGLAAAWPGLWSRISHQARMSLAEWVGWRPVQAIPVWVIVVATPVLIGVLSAFVVMVLHDNEQNLQAKLFESDASRILASVIVVTFVPVAEELIFRGALFNALTSYREGLTFWQRYWLPVTVTAVVFAVIHRFAGVDTLAGMIEITILSFYLSGLRAATGSVRASMVAHFTWNLLGAMALSATSLKT